jgi:hypothetical protein
LSEYITHAGGDKRLTLLLKIVLIKAIDRFTRGGSSAYIKLKEQLDKIARRSRMSY